MEPGEVEAVVASFESVSGCVVKLIKPVQVNTNAALQTLHCKRVHAFAIYRINLSTISCAHMCACLLPSILPASKR
jgi:hypothetical protein